MSTKQNKSDDFLVRSIDDIKEWFIVGSKSKGDLRVGVEIESFVIISANRVPASYDDIKILFDEIMRKYDWLPIYEGNITVGLKKEDNLLSSKITIEPGCQIEFSSAPLLTLHDIKREINMYRCILDAVLPEGMGLLAVGYAPTWSIDSTSRAPKERYRVMERYMPSVCVGGINTMHLSCSTQVNLDYRDESDLIKKMRNALVVQVFLSAMFANSPFLGGRESGFHSYRNEMWARTDKSRTGIPEFVFNNSMSFDAYISYALNIPMYFVFRDGVFIDVAGEKFTDFMEGNLRRLPGVFPKISDWEDHLSTLFPEVRLRPYLEIRGCDAGDIAHSCCIAAIWVGLLYDDQALDEINSLTVGLNLNELLQAASDIPKNGLATKVKNRSMSYYLENICNIARDGLHRRGFKNDCGEDESIFLDYGYKIIHNNESPSSKLIRLYRKEWGNNISNIFEECQFK